MTNRLHVVGATVLVAAVVVLFLLTHRDASPSRSAPITVDRAYTCDELQPQHAAADQLVQQAFERALAAKGLRPTSLPTIRVGNWPGLKTPEDVDKELGQAVKDWEVIPYTFQGTPRSALVGELQQYSMWAPLPVELAIDARGNVWRVTRQPRVRTIARYKANACQWGCFGSPPPGAAPPETYWRDLWFLPAGARYRGEIALEYDAPSIEYENIQNCGLPG
jgi:hypothetical protein